jgi:hypothetical protein
MALSAKKELKLVLELIEMRRKSAEQEFKDALDNHRWSQVSGWHGIETGLIMAKKVIEDELKTL